MSEGEEELNVGAVRLEEVASAANVSLSTASKALRGKPHVSEKTGSARVFAHFGLRPSPWR